jgi:hypothetical protein
VAQQVHVRAVQGHHERHAGEPAGDQAADPGRQPPVGVQHVRAEAPRQPHRRQREGGEEDRQQRQARRGAGPAEQAAPVGQPLEARGGVAEAVDAHPVQVAAARGALVVRAPGPRRPGRRGAGPGPGRAGTAPRGRPRCGGRRTSGAGRARRHPP